MVDRLTEATILQHTFLNLMAAESVNHDLKVESYLKMLCEAVGVKFK